MRSDELDLDGSLGPSLRPGSTFGRYEIIAVLGKGGMGVVYQARDPQLSRDVALKVMRPDVAAKPSSSDRFLREARALAAVRHDHVVEIYEYGELDGVRFVTMPLLAGEHLTARLDRQGALPAAEVVRIGMELAEGLAAVHEKALIHRDVKPSNVWLEAPNGRVKLLDFGLASDCGANDRLTRIGTLVGTPAYMSPEQVNGPEVDARSDLFSLGSVLYEAATGQAAFAAKTHTAILKAVGETDPPSARTVNPNVPPGLSDLIEWLHRKNPADRPSSAAEVARAFRALATARETPTTLSQCDTKLDSGNERKGKEASHRIRLRAPLGFRWFRNRIDVALVLGLVLVLGTVFSTAVALRLRRDHLLRRDKAAAALVESVLNASPAEVQATILSLEPYADVALPLLRSQFESAPAESVQKLHTAFALADLGEVEEDFLIDSIPTVPDIEARNIITALAAAKDSAVPALLQRVEQQERPMAPKFRPWEPWPPKKARYAIALLHLGDPRGAERFLALDPDPEFRTAFIHTFPTWHGDLRQLPAILRRTNTPGFQSGLCAALGLLDPQILAGDEREAQKKVLARLYQEAPDGGTHSAAGWALRKWNSRLPELAISKELPQDRDWFVNTLQMTMLKVPKGSFLMRDYDKPETAQVRITFEQPVFVCDREISVDLFWQFINDSTYPRAKKPERWQGPVAELAPSGDCPVNLVNWFDALLFCNWLSWKEGKSPCYSFRRGESEPTHWDQTADGYRLPTRAEWEYACGAGTTTTFFFGNEIRLLVHYGFIYENSEMHSWPGGLKLPNPWGLFDMYGNVSEWCWDQVGKDQRFILGGFHHSMSNQCSSPNWGPPSVPPPFTGFRVVCGSSQKK
jgi:formylglycine-generating enzyme required for sulfatase activity